MTTKVTWPGSRRFMPWARDRMRHLGGKMLETRTRLQAAMPADLRASSNEVSFSRCFPTPFVKNISLGTNPTTLVLLVEGECMVEQVTRVRKIRRGCKGSENRDAPHPTRLPLPATLDPVDVPDL